MSKGSTGRTGWVIGAHQGNKQVGGGDRALGGKKGVQDRLEGVPRPKLETCSAVRATSGGYGSITQLAEGDPKIYSVLYSVYKHNYTPGRGRSKENKSEEPLCQSGRF